MINKELKEMLFIINKGLVLFYEFKEKEKTNNLSYDDEKLLMSYVVFEFILKEWSELNPKYKKILKELNIKLK